MYIIHRWLLKLIHWHSHLWHLLKSLLRHHLHRHWLHRLHHWHIHLLRHTHTHHIWWHRHIHSLWSNHSSLHLFVLISYISRLKKSNKISFLHKSRYKKILNFFLLFTLIKCFLSIFWRLKHHKRSLEIWLTRYSIFNLF